MTDFFLIIRTPVGEVFSGEVHAFAFNAEDGRVQVLAHHADFMTTLQFSSLFLQSEKQDMEFLARQGIFTFDHKKNEALLLCLYCEKKSEVNYKTTAEYLAFLKEELVRGDLSEYQVLYLKGEKLAIEKQMKVLNP